MAIRLRTVNGIRVALCAVEADPMEGDVYLDDREHYALAAKFSRDWIGHPAVEYPDVWAVMDTQKVRDAREELEKLLAQNVPRNAMTLCEALSCVASKLGPEDAKTVRAAIEVIAGRD